MPTKRAGRFERYQFVPATDGTWDVVAMISGAAGHVREAGFVPTYAILSPSLAPFLATQLGVELGDSAMDTADGIQVIIDFDRPSEEFSVLVVPTPSASYK